MIQTVASALISTDPAFREVLHRVLEEPGRCFELGMEIAVPFIQIGDAQLKQLREVAPQLIFLDLEADPEVGIKLAQFLADQQPGRHFVAAGPTLGPEQLILAMRAGITEYLPKPVTPESLCGALERIQRKLGLGAGKDSRMPGRVMSFFSAKGGSGATTVATNLAIHLHQLTGKRVLLVDLDLELGEIALFLGIQPRFHLVDLVRNFHRMDAELLASYIEQHKSGVHLLSAPYHPERVEAVTAEQIRAILRFLKQHYDFVVVDAPKTFTPATLAAFERADEIYVVSNVDLPSLRNIKRSLPLLDQVTDGGVGERVRLLVTRYNSAANEISLEEVERTLGLKIFWKLGNDYATVSRAMNTGEPLVLDRRGSAFAAEIRALGAELAGLGAVAPKRERLAGIRRLFGVREAVHG